MNVIISDQQYKTTFNNKKIIEYKKGNPILEYLIDSVDGVICNLK